MSEAPAKKFDVSELQAITSDDFVDFLAGKGWATSCPVCAQSGWSIASPNPNYAFLDVQRHAHQPQHLPLAALVCETCGYVRLHALAAIATWKRGKNGNQE